MSAAMNSIMSIEVTAYLCRSWVITSWCVRYMYVAHKRKTANSKAHTCSNKSSCSWIAVILLS